MKILIILPYFNRPNMVRFALDSIAAYKRDNYDLGIIDDGSVVPIRTVLDKYLWTEDFVTICETDDSIEQKIAQGGSRHGHFINELIDGSNADIGIILCDDDALYPGYLEGLEEYYETHPDVNYSYGHVETYSPYEDKNYNSITGNPISFLNNHFYPIDPFCQVDASQVSWRMGPYKHANISFPALQTSALDADVFKQMYQSWGPCQYNGLVTQYKGWFPDQMGNRSDLLIPTDKDNYVPD